MEKYGGQNTIRFFHPEETPPSREVCLWAVDPDNPLCQLHDFVGNRKAVEKVVKVGFMAKGRWDHSCPELSLAFLGPSGCGKTQLAERVGKLTGLPFAKLLPKSLTTVSDVARQMMTCLEDFSAVNVPKGGLKMIAIAPKRYEFTPMHVFFDEVHALPNNVVQGILNAIESKDRTLVTENGDVFDTRRVQWNIATTDRGELFDAFDTRFLKVELTMYTDAEMAKIIQVNNPMWHLSDCMIVARYASRIPREAIEFSREMMIEYQMRPGTLNAVARRVAEDNGIELIPEGDDGSFRPMTLARLAILKSLGNKGPMSLDRLQNVINKKSREIKKFIMPWLEQSTPGRDALVTVSSRGFQITREGLAELRLRGLDCEDRHAG